MSSQTRHPAFVVSLRSAALAALVVCAALLTQACQKVEETSRTWPISAGRYYPAVEVAAKHRDSILIFTDFTQDSLRFTDYLQLRPGCPIFLIEGEWFVYTNTDYSEPQLKKNTRRAAGGTGYTACVTTDSLAKPYLKSSQTSWIRNITDTSFQVCTDANKICFGKCTAPTTNVRSECYGYDPDQPLDSLWDTWVK